MQYFKKLKVYQQALNLITTVYQVSAFFPKSETYGLTSQMRRASTSVALNIAEGQGKQSAEDRYRFLLMARGSLYELVAILDISQRTNLLTLEKRNQVEMEIKKTLKLLNGFIKYQKSKT